MESSSPLTIETKSLSKGLWNNHLETFLNEMSQSIAVFIKTTWSKALVSSVKEREQVISFQWLSDFVPLFRCGVNSSWIVCTGMEENYWTRLRIIKVSKHPFKIKTFSLWVIVGILSDFKPSMLENLCMSCPCWFRNVDRCFSILVQEICTYL